MKELSLETPDLDTLEDWNEEALQEFGKQDWIGRLESSGEVHLLSGTRPIDGVNTDIVEPLLDNLRVLACFKDISIEEVFDLRHDEEYVDRLNRINNAFQENYWEMSSYLESIYNAVPSRDVSTVFFSAPVEIGNLNYNLAVVEEIEEAMREEDEFYVTGVELNVYSEDDDPEWLHQGLEDDLFFNLYFVYDGDKTAIREYNQITDKWGDSKKYSGIPGVVNIGKERPNAHFFDSEELSIHDSRLDDWLYDNLSPSLGARSRIKKRKY